MRCQSCGYHTRQSPCHVCRSHVAVQRIDGPQLTHFLRQTPAEVHSVEMRRGTGTPPRGKPPQRYTADRILAQARAWVAANPGRELNTNVLRAVEGLPGLGTIQQYFGTMNHLRDALGLPRLRQTPDRTAAFARLRAGQQAGLSRHALARETGLPLTTVSRYLRQTREEGTPA